MQIPLVVIAESLPLSLASLIPHEYKECGVITIVIEPGIYVLITGQLPHEYAVHTINWHIKPLAQVRIINQVNAKVHHMFTLERESILNGTFLLHEAPVARASWHVLLAGEHAQSRIAIGVVAYEQESIELITQQQHSAPATTSEISCYGLLADHASLNFQGLITIEKSAPLSNASLVNKNFLLHAGAKAVSVPSLQVLTNDVQCRHGSATGHLDEEQLWVLQSRGLSREQAQRMLVLAFMGEVLNTIPDESQRAIVEKNIMHKLGKGSF